MALGKNSVFCRFAADILGNMKKIVVDTFSQAS